MLESDKVLEQERKISKEAEKTSSKPEKRSRTGFNKRLLKSAMGEEQCFEEARAKFKWFSIAPSSVNFNLLHVEKVDQSSQMDLDEEESMDVSMSESLPPSPQNNASDQPRKFKRLNPNEEGRVLFRAETSFEASWNQTANSNASSTIHELDGVGVATKKEEETINTKFAMKELSMMFSSPALGVEDSARKIDRDARVSQSIDDNYHNPDMSYGNVGDVLSTSVLDNSILNVESNHDENRGPRNPFARSTTTPGFEKMALRELEAIGDRNDSLGCSSQMDHRDHHSSQENPLGGPEVDLSEDPGFRIYEDGVQEDLKENNRATSGELGFRIYEEEDSEVVEKESVVAIGPGFSVYEDDSSSDDGDFPVTDDMGDTASLSLFGDAVAMLDCKRRSSTNLEETDSVRRPRDSSGGDTATFSLFNEVFQNGNHTNQSPLPPQVGGFQIHVDEDQEDEVS